MSIAAIVPVEVLAVDSCNIFTSGAQSHSSSGSITIQSGATINNGGTSLQTPSLTDNGNNLSCGTADCMASGTYIDALTFSYPSVSYGSNTISTGSSTVTSADGSWSSVTIGSGGSLEFTTVGGSYYIETLSLSENGTLILAPGDYYIKNGTVIPSNASIQVSGSSGTARIFISQWARVDIADFSGVSAPDRLFIWVDAHLTISVNAVTKGFFYANNIVGISGGVTLEGGVAAGGQITFNANSTVNYSDSSGLDMTNLCLGGTSGFESSLMGEWQFDELTQWDGTSGELTDSTTNGFNGAAVSASGFPQRETINPALGNTTSGTCSYADFTGGEKYFYISDPGTDSLLDAASEFTVALWARVEELSTGGIHHILVMKSGNYQFLVDDITGLVTAWWLGSSALSITSPSSLTLNTWHHLAFTFENGSQKLYIDGVEVNASSYNTTASTGNQPIFIGRHENHPERDLHGDLDEVRFYNQALSVNDIQSVMNESRTCSISVTPNNIDIMSSSVASTCAPESITIAIRNSSNQIITDYSGTITLTTSTGHGDWELTGASEDAYGTLIVGANDSGAATYTFDADDKGSVTLNLSNTRAESLTVGVVENVAGAASTSAAITYSTNSFIFAQQGEANHITGRTDTWVLQMQSTDPSSGECAVNTNYNQTGVKIWMTRQSNDPGGAAPALTDAASSSTVTLPVIEPLVNNFNLTFTNGVASFNLATSDVIAFDLNVKDDSRSFADVDVVAVVTDINYGPFGFYLSVEDNAGEDNPGAVNASGDVFTQAGQNFTVTATAVAWAADDDANSDGIPDNHNAPGSSSRADLSNNSALVSFGQEAPPETLSLSSTLLLPSEGADAVLQSGALSGDATIISSFNSGSGSTTEVYFDEVGIIELTARVSDNEYLGKGIPQTAAMTSYSGNVGRFIPAHFTFSSKSLTAACTIGLDFSYMGQAFTSEFTISPQSQKGTALGNYTGDFAKLSVDDFLYYAQDINVGARLDARLNDTASSLNWSISTGTVNTTFSLARTLAPDGPYETLQIATDFNDSDGVGLNSADRDFDADGDTLFDAALIGETEVRYGRLSLSDAHGPETAALAVPLRIEYWDSPDWLINQDDSCTKVALTDVQYPAGAASNSANRLVTIGSSGSTMGRYSYLADDVINFNEGDAGHSYSAPGAGNTGSFNTAIDLTDYPWLRFDWDGDNDYSDVLIPENQINFGSYRGNDRLIFWREY